MGKWQAGEVIIFSRKNFKILNICQKCLKSTSNVLKDLPDATKLLNPVKPFPGTKVYIFGLSPLPMQILCSKLFFAILLFFFFYSSTDFQKFCFIRKWHSQKSQ